MYKPHVTVAAMIEREQKFLLVEEQSDGLIVFNQPAGHLDEGESLIQAVTRETLEEAGWHFTPEFVIGIYQYTSAFNITYLRICFGGKLGEHDVQRPLDKGILRAVWLTRPEIAAKENLRSPLVMRCIDDYLQGIRYPLTLLTHL